MHDKNTHLVYLSSRGFTLIELLVVIAIIGILSSVVLSSITTARTQAYDAKVKAQLTNVRSAAELYYSSHFTYGTSNMGSTTGCTATSSIGMWADSSSGMSQLDISVNYPVGENTIVCNSNGSAYAVGDNLYTPGNYWCVDSLGRSTATSGPVVAGVTLVCK